MCITNKDLTVIRKLVRPANHSLETVKDINISDPIGVTHTQLHNNRGNLCDFNTLQCRKLWIVSGIGIMVPVTRCAHLISNKNIQNIARLFPVCHRRRQRRRNC